MHWIVLFFPDGKINLDVCRFDFCLYTALLANTNWIRLVGLNWGRQFTETLLLWKKTQIHCKNIFPRSWTITSIFLKKFWISLIYPSVIFSRITKIILNMSSQKYIKEKKIDLLGSSCKFLWEITRNAGLQMSCRKWDCFINCVKRSRASRVGTVTFHTSVWPYTHYSG